MTPRPLPDRIKQRLSPLAPLLLRIPLGAVFIAHGGQSMFGWWGGAGFAQTLLNYQTQLGFAPALAAPALLVQFFGGIMLLVGLLTRPIALLLAALMAVALFKVHLVHGFFLNWQLVTGRGHGIEYSLVLIGMCLALVCSGAGAWAVDRADG